MKDAYVHIGLPRCASTLIENFFQHAHRAGTNALRASDILALPRLYMELRRAAGEPEWDDEFCTYLRDYHLVPMLGHEAKGFFVKDESLTFVNNQDFDAPTVYLDRMQFLPKLFEGFRPRLLLLVRNQARYLVSLYGLHLQNGGQMDFVDYVDGYPLARLDWLAVAEAAADAVGEENLTVLPFEREVYAASEFPAGDFLAALQHVMGVADPVDLGDLPLVNPSLSPKYYAAQLAINHAGDCAAAEGDAAIPDGDQAYLWEESESPLTPDRAARVLDSVTQSNAGLFARFMPDFDPAFYHPGALA